MKAEIKYLDTSKCIVFGNSNEEIIKDFKINHPKADILEIKKIK